MDAPEGRRAQAAVAAAMREAGVEGVEWEEIPLDATDPASAVAWRLSAATPAAEAASLRTIVVSVLDLAPWCSVPVLRFQPEGARARIVLRAEILFFEPAAALESAAAREAIDGGASSHPDRVAEAIWNALQARFEGAGLPVTEHFDRIRNALYVWNMAFAGDRDEAMRDALRGLDEECGRLVRDMLRLTWRERDHDNTRIALDTYLEEERRTPDGRPRGRVQSHGTWVPPPRRAEDGANVRWSEDPARSAGGEELADLDPVPAAGTEETVARLGTVIGDELASEGRRLDALRDLARIDHPEARAWRLRALGHSRIFLNAVHYAPIEDAKPLFREIALSRDDRRIAAALALLRRYGRDGLDARTIWAAAATASADGADVRSAALYRHSLFSAWARTIEEQGGPPDAIDREVVEAVRGELPEHSDDPLWTSDAQELLRASAAAVRGTRVPPPPPAAVPSLLPPDGGGASFDDESAIIGVTPEETAQRRFARWLSPGYAVRRYRASGHRDPRWDGLVEAAHSRYVGAQPHPGAHPEIVDLYERAIVAGCRDPIVVYRSGACAMFRGDHTLAKRRLAEALEDMAARYPHAPYASSAALALARYAEGDGRFHEALTWARRAVASPEFREKGALEAVRKLEDHAAARDHARRLTDLRLGTLRVAPGLRHAAPVTALAVGRGREPFIATGDDRGVVQVTRAEYRAHGWELVPFAREELHGAGRAALAWLGERELVSAGGDRAVHRLEVGEDRRLRVLSTTRVEEPVTAFAPAPFVGLLAMGDGAGRLLALTEAGAVEPLARLRLGPIRRIIAHATERRLAAVDAEGRVAVLDDAGPRTLDVSVPFESETLLFHPLSGELVGCAGGQQLEIDPRTGAIRAETPLEDDPRQVHRFGPGTRELIAWQSGSIRVAGSPTMLGVSYAGRDPLALVEAGWEQGLVAFVTRSGWIRHTTFGV